MVGEKQKQEEMGTGIGGKISQVPMGLKSNWNLGLRLYAGEPRGCGQRDCLNMKFWRRFNYCSVMYLRPTG